MKNFSLKSKCFAASFWLVCVSLLSANSAIFSGFWSDFVGLNWGGKNQDNSMNITLASEPSHYGNERIYSKNSECRPSDFQHLIGLPKSILVNFYIPADTIVSIGSPNEQSNSSKFNRLFIKLDGNGFVEKVICY